MAVARKVMQYVCIVGALALQSGTAVAEPENGWWWNPNESGRGFFIETTGGVVYMAGYFYENDGRATWLSSGGSSADPYAYRGTLHSYRNGQTLFGAYRPPDPGVDVGPVELQFSDDAHGSITWPGGTIPIERIEFGIDEDFPLELLALGIVDPPFRPQTGWWWNETESGRGFSVEVQGANLFVVSFMYDDAGNPVWYFSAGPMSTPTHYEGDVLLFSGGQTLTGPYHPPASNEKIGRMTIDFAAADDATITITDAVSSNVLVSGTISKNNTGPKRNRPLIPSHIWYPHDQWPQWVGTVDHTWKETSEAGTTGTFTLDGKVSYSLHWIRVQVPPGSRALARYTLANTSSATYDFSTLDTSNGCRETAHEIYGGLTGSLTIYWDMSYVGTVKTPVPLSADVHLRCDDGQGNVKNADYSQPLGGFEAGFGGRSQHVANMSSSSMPNATNPPTMHGVRLLAPPSEFLRWGLTAR